MPRLLVLLSSLVILQACGNRVNEPAETGSENRKYSIYRSDGADLLRILQGRWQNRPDSPWYWKFSTLKFAGYT
ncbi:MAG: hypothetical protein R2778_18515 [Saprospiraceae bacterium]